MLTNHDEDQERGEGQKNARDGETVEKEESSPSCHGKCDERTEARDRQEQFRKRELRALHC